MLFSLRPVHFEFGQTWGWKATPPPAFAKAGKFVRIVLSAKTYIRFSVFVCWIDPILEGVPKPNCNPSLHRVSSHTNLDVGFILLINYRWRTFVLHQTSIRWLIFLMNPYDHAYPLFMVRMVGLELTTYGTQNRRATRLRYTRIFWWSIHDLTRRRL